MKVLLDANVIVAAFAAHGLCEAVFEVCLDAHDLLLSTELLDEVSKNLRKKIKLPDATVASILRLLRENSALHSPHHVPAKACRDPKDLHILGLAESGGADCIVTGDKDLLTLRKFKSCKILTPRQFSDLIHGKRIQQVWRYAKLGITNRSSDGKPLGFKRLDRNGNSELKAMSYWAWKGSLWKKDQTNEVRRFYERSLARTHNKVHARLNTQRKILSTMWGLWKRKETYRPELFCPSDVLEVIAQ